MRQGLFLPLRLAWNLCVSQAGHELVNKHPLLRSGDFRQTTNLTSSFFKSCLILKASWLSSRLFLKIVGFCCCFCFSADFSVISLIHVVSGHSVTLTLTSQSCYFLMIISQIKMQVPPIGCFSQFIIWLQIVVKVFNSKYFIQSSKSVIHVE